MPRKYDPDAIAMPPDDTRYVEVIKHTVIGTVEIGFGDKQPLNVFAEMAMADAREDMTSGSVTESTYQFTDDHSITRVTINNTPHNLDQLPRK